MENNLHIHFVATTAWIVTVVVTSVTAAQSVEFDPAPYAGLRSYPTGDTGWARFQHMGLCAGGTRS